MEDLETISLKIHFKIDSIDRRMFVFALCTEDVIKLGLIERTDKGY